MKKGKLYQIVKGPKFNGYWPFFCPESIWMCLEDLDQSMIDYIKKRDTCFSPLIMTKLCKKCYNEYSTCTKVVDVYLNNENYGVLAVIEL